MRSGKIFNLLLIAALLLAAVATPAVSAAAPVTSDPSAAPSKIEPLVLDQIAAEGQTEFFVWLVEKADLSPADQLQTKQEKGRFVFNALVETADRTQKDLRAFLDAQGAKYQPFYIANKILVQGGDQALVMDLAARPDVARITANHPFQLQEPFKDKTAPEQVTAIESNVTFINADDVWALGYTGAGTVMAGNDTGLDWDHPALINQYRGWDGATADHNYNWWDATGTYPTVPDDGHGHGTHTTGTMVGDDGGANQIGVAPGAQTIHCKNMTNSGSGDDATFTTCFQWDLAPWDLTGANPDPDMAPDAINNSWGYAGGGDNVFRDEIQALHAAGILVEVSAGNEGSSCSSLRSPGDYWEVMTTGSVNHAGGVLPGTLTGFSSRGPSDLDPTPPNYFPDITAPGENIRSSVPGGGYEGGWSGTSMAGPHATALVGLMWSACPTLQGRVEDTIQLIQDTAVPLTGQSGSNCGGDYTDGPNNDWGFGTIDALAAVNAVLAQCGGLGYLDGHVYDSDTMLPLEDATVEATLSPTQTWETSTDDQGYYQMTVLTGTYTVEAWKYGYIPEQVMGVEVFSGTVTTQDFALDPAPSALVYGTVTDANTGWPLYAGIDIAGYPYGTIWTDPETGYYEVSLPEGSTYDFTVEAWVAGYLPLSADVGPVMGNMEASFALDVDTGACEAPGYSPSYFFFDDFESGYANWTMTGLWNEENEADACGSLVAPFPSSSNASWYGIDGVCTFNNGSANSGELTMVTPVPLPPTGAALSLWSYEQTECGGDCGYDNRYVEISIDGGATWSLLGEGNTENTWYKLQYDLAAYAGNDALFRFRFDTVDSIGNDYFGWMVDDVAVATGCDPAAGGLVVGYVYDLNTSDPLDGADVWNETGEAMVTSDGGFYTLFSPPGLNDYWATADGYSTVMETVDVGDGATTQQDFYLGTGYLEFAPTSLEATLDMGDSTMVPASLSNSGTGDAFFELQEIDEGYQPTLISIPPSDGNFPRGDGAPSAGPAPIEANPDAVPLSAPLLSPGTLAYATEASNGFHTQFDLDVPEILPNLGPFTPADFPGAGEFVNGYVYVADVLNNLYQLDPATGAVLSTIPITPPPNAETYSGFALDSTSGLLYASSTNVGTSSLFTVDVDTGVATLIGPITGSGCNIAIAIDGTGQIYGYDICTDDFWAIDKNTGAGTVIGSIGFDANFGQGMAWDPATDQIYLAAFNYGTFQPELRVADPATGNTMLVGVLGSTDPGGTCQLPWLGIPIAAGGDVPWLSEDPISGTVPVDGVQPIDVTFDAGVPEVTQPGEYYATLKVNNDTVYGPLYVPVTLTVVSPATYGKLNGWVSGLGYCDADDYPLEEAEVLIESATGSWTLLTDPDGYYQIWLDEAESPLDVTVTYPEHETGYATDVPVVGGMTTTVDFDLRWLRPCLSVVPDSLSASLNLGETDTQPVTLTNDGAAEANFEMQEVDEGYVPALTAGVVPEPNTRERTQSYDPEAVTTAGILSPGGSEPMNLLGAGDVLVQWPTGDTLNWGDGFSLSDGMVWINDNAAGGGSGLNEEFDVAGNRTGRNFTPSFGGSWPGDMAFNPNTGMFWQVNVGGDNCIYEWDPAIPAATGNSICGVPWTSTSQRGLAYDPTDDTFFIGGWNEYIIYHIQGETGPNPGEVIEQWNVGLSIAGLAYNFEAGQLFIIENTPTDTVSQFDVASGTIVNSFTVAGFGNYVGAGLAIDCDGNLWAPNQGNNNAYLIDSGVPANLCGGDVDWLSEDPISGTVPADGGQMVVDVTFDAGAVPQAGQYFATLNVKSDDPENGTIGLPVVMEVLAPPDYGKLTGVVAGLGHCDAETYPLQGADVVVVGEITITTDAAGVYGVWLQEGVYTVEAYADEHLSASAMVTITAQMTTTQDLGLRSIQPCMSVTPDAMSVALESGDSWSEMLTLVNDGAGPSAFSVRETTQTLSLLNMAAGPIALVSDGSQLTAITSILDEMDLAYEVWNDNEPNYYMADPGFLNSYGFIIWYASGASGIGRTITQAEHDATEAWLQAGGNLLATGYDTLGSPDDPLMAALVRSSSYGDGPFIYDYQILLDHPITNGPYGVYPPGYAISADASDHDQAEANTAQGAVTVAQLTDGHDKIIATELASGGRVVYWNGNQNVADWLTTLSSVEGVEDKGMIVAAPGNPTSVDAQNLFKNTVDWLTAGGDVKWLDEDPKEGEVLADSAFDVEVTFTALPTLPLGIYTATLLVDTDDAVNSEFHVPVQMEIVECVEVSDVAVSVLNTDPIYPDDLVELEADIIPDNAAKPYSYTIDYDDGTTDEGASSDDPLLFNHAYAEAGTYLVEVAAWNCDMTEPVVGTVEVVVEPVPCTEVVTMTMSMLTPYPIYMGDMVDFEVDIVPDEFTPPFSYTIDYGDGTPPVMDTSSDDPMAFSHAFADSGTMRVQIQIWNCGMTVPVSDWMDVEVMEPMFYIYLPVVVKDAD